MRVVVQACADSAAAVQFREALASGGASCDLTAHADADRAAHLRLFFSGASQESAQEGSAAMGIEISGVIERAAGVCLPSFCFRDTARQCRCSWRELMIIV